MTGPDLHALRRDYVLGNTRKLARLLGCHPSTINRNVGDAAIEHREHMI